MKQHRVVGHGGNHRLTRLLLAGTCFVLSIRASAAEQHTLTDPPGESPRDLAGQVETDPAVLQKLEWFQDLKFGLLMHWGTYSQWQIVESWSLCPEDENWCERRGPYAQDYFAYKQAYENLKTTFNPVKFDPDAWAAAARKAGLRYVVFTTKHHDGFCMFDTQETDYKVTAPDCPFSANPRSNIAREIFRAFRAQGFGVGAYFSKPDWHCPDYWWPYFPPLDRNVNYDLTRYPEKWKAFKAFTHNQIRELMSDYGPIDILWLDGGWVQPMTSTSPRWGTRPCDQDIDMPAIAAMARARQPGLIIVDRAVEGRFQNYRTPEQHVPDTPPDFVWETCLTMATSWSYVATDTYKPARELIHLLIDIVAKGGNLLLNIGPSPAGELAPAALERLEELGAWMEINSGALYGSRAVAPYREGRVCYTRMPDGTIHALYLAAEGEERPPARITMTAFTPRAGSSVSMLGVAESLAWEVGAQGVVVHVPESVRSRPPCQHAWVLRLTPAMAGAAQGAALRGDGDPGPAIRARVEPDSTVFVADGRSAFSIWVSAQAGPSTLAIADTLRRYVRLISAVDLPVTRAEEPAGRRIVLEVGESRVPDVDLKALGSDGFRIQTADGDILLTAGTEDGLQNAVYTFLETYLGCRQYSPTVTVVPRRDVIVLPRIDVTQVPPIGFRLQSFRAPAYEAWHKLNTNETFGLFVHTFATLVPPQKYFAEHPEYFSLLKGHRTPDGQLCLTNPDVLRIVVDELRARMRARPEATFWSVSQNDTYAPCECDACQAIDRVEGSPTGSLLAFVNRVAAEFPDRTISTLAYQYTRAAPKTIKPLPNVNIMLCSIECNRSRPLAADPSSASFVRDVEDWCALTRNIFLWDYVIQFRNLVSPFPNLRVLQPNIQFFVRHHIPAVFQQGLGELHGEFAELRAYLIAKLLWNPDVDIDAVMDDFLQGFYGAAAPFVRGYIDAMHDALEASGEELSIYGYPWPSEDGYLSPARMDAYGPLFDQAEAAVSGDPELLERVQTARLPLQFALLEQAKVIGAGERGAFVRGDDGMLRKRPEVEALLAVFVERCRRAGIPRLWEHGTPPDEYLTMTRRFLDESVQRHLALGRPVSLKEPASAKYHNGDERALTNGLKGWDDYHTHWLGFEGTDMEAVIDLGSVRTVTSVATDFLQDINSWVFMPLEVACAVSADGQSYTPIGEVANTVPAERWGPIIAPFDFSFEPRQARYVKVTARGMKTCPTWHKGSGGLAWIFIDEIRVF